MTWPRAGSVALVFASVALVGLAGCFDDSPELVVSNGSGIPIDLQIEIRKNGELVRQYDVTAPVGVTVVEKDLNLRGEHEFIAHSERGTVTKIININRSTADVGLFVANDAYEWTTLHADP